MRVEIRGGTFYNPIAFLSMTSGLQIDITDEPVAIKTTEWEPGHKPQYPGFIFLPLPQCASGTETLKIVKSSKFQDLLEACYEEYHQGGYIDNLVTKMIRLFENVDSIANIEDVIDTYGGDRLISDLRSAQNDGDEDYFMDEVNWATGMLYKKLGPIYVNFDELQEALIDRIG